MTIEEARKIVFDAVEEHGPEKAKEVLEERMKSDNEFMLTCAHHGGEIVKAMLEAQGQTVQ
jgi:hypothetical protein